MIILSSRLLKNNFKSKLKLVDNAGLNLAFKHCISFATDLAPNFGSSCNWFRLKIMPEIVSKLLSTASLIGIWADALFSDSDRQVVSLDLLLSSCTGFNSELEDLFICPIFTERPRSLNDQKIEQRDEQRWLHWALLWLVTSSSEIHRIFFHMKFLLLLKFTQHQNLFASDSQTKSVSQEWSGQHGFLKRACRARCSDSDCRRLGNALCLCSPVWPAHISKVGSAYICKICKNIDLCIFCILMAYFIAYFCCILSIFFAYFWHIICIFAMLKSM